MEFLQWHFHEVHGCFQIELEFTYPYLVLCTLCY